MRTAVVVLLLLARLAHAEDGEVTATALAVAGSLIGPATIAVGIEEGNYADSPLHDEIWPIMGAGAAAIILLPSLGNWYAGQWNSPGLDLRIGGALTTAAGVGIFAANFSLSSDHGSDAGVLIGGLIALGGAGMIATGTVLDVINAPRAAAKHHLAIAPMVGSKQSGFAIAGTF